MFQKHSKNFTLNRGANVSANERTRCSVCECNAIAGRVSSRKSMLFFCSNCHLLSVRQNEATPYAVDLEKLFRKVRYIGYVTFSFVGVLFFIFFFSIVTSIAAALTCYSQSYKLAIHERSRKIKMLGEWEEACIQIESKFVDKTKGAVEHSSARAREISVRTR